MAKAFSVLLISTLYVGLAPAQERVERLPPLNVTEWIHGSKEDVGDWGDGKVYVLEFWGTWCSPCIEVIPHLTELQREYADRGLVVIGYTWEDAAEVRAFHKRMGEKMDYVVVTDTEEKTLSALAEAGVIQGFPYSFLVDRDGRVVWSGNSKHLTAAVDDYFN